MKKELINELFIKFEQTAYLYKNIECWSARELQIILGYAKWDNFLKVIDKAKNSCEGSGVAVSNHFADIGKMVDIGSGSQREIDDVALMPVTLLHKMVTLQKVKLHLLKLILLCKLEGRKLLSNACWMLQGFLQEKNYQSQKKSYQE